MKCIAYRHLALSSFIVPCLLSHQNRVSREKKYLIPPGLEPGTLRVLGARDNHYTMETRPLRRSNVLDALLNKIAYNIVLLCVTFPLNVHHT